MGILTFKPQNKPDIGDIGCFLVVEEGKVMHLSEVSPSPGETWDGAPGSLTQVRALLPPWTAGLLNCYNLALLVTKSKRNEEGEFWTHFFFFSEETTLFSLTHFLPVVLSTTYLAIGLPSEANKRQLQPGVMDKGAVGGQGHKMDSGVFVEGYSG